MRAGRACSSIADGDDRGGGGARQRLALLVDEEHPVGVAVEGEARRRRPSRAPRACRSRRFSGWIGSAGWLGNVPSSSPYSTLEVDGQARRTPRAPRGRPCRWRCRPRPCSGRSADEVDERAHVVGEGAGGGRGARAPPARAVVRGHALGGHRLDLGAGRCPRRSGRAPAQAQLHAVVLGRVVRGGEHGAGRVELAGGEVHEVGGRQPEVDDVDALGADAVGEGRRQLHARRGACRVRRAPASAPPTWPATKTAKASPTARATGVELVGRGAPDVVGLEDRVEVGHGRSP